MRINFTEEEDHPGQFELWQANCERSLRGKAGRAELLILREAILALPEKRLICGLLEHDGEVCAVGAYARHKGMDLALEDPEDSTDEVGIAAGMPKLMAWKVVEMNDIMMSELTPERRYEAMLKWIDSHLEAIDGKS